MQDSDNIESTQARKRRLVLPWVGAVSGHVLPLFFSFIRCLTRCLTVLLALRSHPATSPLNVLTPLQKADSHLRTPRTAAPPGAGTSPRVIVLPISHSDASSMKLRYYLELPLSTKNVIISNNTASLWLFLQQDMTSGSKLLHGLHTHTMVLPVQRVLNLRFGFHIDRAGAVVQDQDAGMRQQRAGDGDALLLPAR